MHITGRGRRFRHGGANVNTSTWLESALLFFEPLHLSILSKKLEKRWVEAWFCDNQRTRSTHDPELAFRWAEMLGKRHACPTCVSFFWRQSVKPLASIAVETRQLGTWVTRDVGGWLIPWAQLHLLLRARRPCSQWNLSPKRATAAKMIRDPNDPERKYIRIRHRNCCVNVPLG